jgi:hypothetical protein
MLNENELVEIINNIYYYLYINYLEEDIYKRKRSIILLCALLIVALILPCSGSETASKFTKKQRQHTRSVWINIFIRQMVNL